MTPILVGELNPYGADPALALYHHPRHASGNRLRQFLGLRDHEYAALPRHNLCTGRWSLPVARGAATALLQRYEPGAVFLALGRKVQAAFGLPDRAQWFSAHRTQPQIMIPSGTVVALPHPSGLNPVWRQRDAVDQVRAVLLEHCPGHPWGEAPDAAPTLYQANTEREDGQDPRKYEVGRTLTFRAYDADEVSTLGEDHQCTFQRGDRLVVLPRNGCGMGIDVRRASDDTMDMVWPTEVQVTQGGAP